MTHGTLADLHLHSNCSDGSDTPSQLVGEASRYCSTIALTDHDTTAGLDEAIAAGAAHGVDVLPGVELSIPVDGPGSLHLLIYLSASGILGFQHKLASLRDRREERNHEIALRMASDGIPITYEMVLEKAAGGNVGRPHFGAVLVDLGLVATITDAFTSYLGKGGRYYVSKGGLTIEEAITFAVESGSVTSIAHPTMFEENLDRLEHLLGAYVEMGLSGLECYYSRYSPAQRKSLAAIARRKGIIATGGSDYHGTFKQGLTPGIGEGDLVVPAEAVQEIKHRIS